MSVKCPAPLGSTTRGQVCADASSAIAHPRADTNSRMPDRVRCVMDHLATSAVPEPRLCTLGSDAACSPHTWRATPIQGVPTGWGDPPLGAFRGAFDGLSDPSSSRHRRHIEWGGSPLSWRGIVVSAWFSLWLAAGPATAEPPPEASQPPRAEVGSRMAELVEALRVALPLSLDPAAFAAEANRARLEQALRRLRDGAASLAQHGRGRDVGFSYLASPRARRAGDRASLGHGPHRGGALPARTARERLRRLPLAAAVRQEL